MPVVSLRTGRILSWWKLALTSPKENYNGLHQLEMDYNTDCAAMKINQVWIVKDWKSQAGMKLTGLILGHKNDRVQASLPKEGYCFTALQSLRM